MKKQKNKKKIRTLIGIISLIVIVLTASKPANAKNNIYKTVVSKLNNMNLNTDEDLEEVYNCLLEDLNLKEQKDILTKIKCLLNSGKLDLDYSEYLETLTDEYRELKDLENLIPQGITTYDDYVLFSAYDPSKKTPSCIYTIDEESNIINKTYLDNNSHVGGITYDDLNNLLWVTVNKGVSAYDIEEIISKESVECIYQDEIIEKKDRCSFITYYNKKLYIGTYKSNNNSTLREYIIPYLKETQKEIKLVKTKEFKIPRNVQGVAFALYDDETYLFLSRSFGQLSNSYITIYNYYEKETSYTDNYTTIIKCPPMIEEIYLNQNNQLLSLYESCAQKFNKCPSNMKHIYYSDINKLIKK